jgi:hypothetical protein
MGNPFEQAPAAPAEKPGKDAPKDPGRREFFRKLAGTSSPEAPAATSSAPRETPDRVAQELKRRDELSRREFLEILAGGSLAGMVSWSFKGLLDEVGGEIKYAIESFKRERRETPLSELIISARAKAFEARYAIPVVFDNPHWDTRKEFEPTHSEEAWSHEKIQALEVLEDVCSNYPEWLIREAHIPSITIRRRVSDSRGSLDGLAVSRDDNRIMLSAGSPIVSGMSAPEPLSERTVHHELFHAIDPFKDEKNDETWSKMNRASGSEYGLRPSSEDDNLPREGYARVYGEAGSFEDRATICEKLWEDPLAVLDRKTPAALSGNDLLQNKAELMEQALFLRSKGMFTRVFWYRNAYGSEIDGSGEPGLYVRFDPQRHFQDMEKEILGSTYEQIKKSYKEFANVSPEQYAKWQEFYLQRKSPAQ